MTLIEIGLVLLEADRHRAAISHLEWFQNQLPEEA